MQDNGLVHEQKGDIKEAVRLMRKSVDIRKGRSQGLPVVEDVKSYRLDAESALRLGDYDEAIKKFSKSLREALKDSERSWDTSGGVSDRSKQKYRETLAPPSPKAYHQNKNFDIFASMYSKLALAYREKGEEGSGID
mgnify:CR=1 FL=1